MPFEYSRKEDPSLGMQMLQEGACVLALGAIASSFYVFFIVEEPGQLLLAPFGVLCIWVGPAMLFFYNLNQKLIERRKQGFQRVFLTVMWLSIGVSVLSIGTIAIGLAYVFLVMSFHS